MTKGVEINTGRSLNDYHDGRNRLSVGRIEKFTAY